MVTIESVWWIYGHQWQILFSDAPKSLRMVIAAMKLKDACSLEGKLWQTPDSILKSRDITFPTKVSVVKAMVSPVVMCGCELDHKESWALKNWCFWTVVLEKTLESPLDFQIKPVNSKRNQSWIFFGRTDGEAETSILWPPDAKNWLTGKDPDSWESLKAGGEGDDRGWNGWMASPTGWTWVWTNSARWWWTGKPGVLQSMGSQRIRHDWVTELNWIATKCLWPRMVFLTDFR